MMENLKEGWVSFTRFHCKEGYIDYWTGDCINNPNNPTKRGMQLSSFSAYYRLNGGEWTHREEVRHIHHLLRNREVFTAQEIWDEASR